jgi:predicted transcriptional regulator
MQRERRGQRRTTDVTGEQKYLGALQSLIMEIAWKRGRVTVREVLADLQGSRAIAYTTVMTVMARLAEQGVLTRERVGRADFYRPACTREQFRVAISGAIVHDLVTDFGEVALAQFVDALEEADPARLARLQALLEQKTQAPNGA